MVHRLGLARGSLGDADGLDAYTEFLRASVGSFSDLHLTIHDVIADANKVVVRFMNGGRSTAPFLGAAPSDEEVSWNGIGL